MGVPNADAHEYVAVYRLISNEEWELLRTEITEDYGDRVVFGTIVDLSADGMAVTAGSVYSQGLLGQTQVFAGQARIFTLESDQWLPKRPALFGALCRSLGCSIVLSGDANRRAVSTSDVFGSGNCHDDFFDKRGQVQILDYGADTRTWVQSGKNLTGRRPGSFFVGVSVARSRDGKRVAVSSPDRSDLGVNTIFHASEQSGSTSGQWQQGDSSIIVEISEFYTPRGVALSADGKRVAAASKRFVDGAASVCQDSRVNGCEVGAAWQKHCG